MKTVINLIDGTIEEVPLPEEELLERIAAESARLNAMNYSERRASEYPSFADQFDLLYHGGYDAWKAAIQVIKDKYPK